MAVGNATHIYQNWRYRAKKKINYMQITMAFGSHSVVTQTLKGISDYPQNCPKTSHRDCQQKRAEYRRRYALLEQLGAGLAAHFM